MENEKGTLNISIRSFIVAIAVIFVLMVASYAMTFVVPGGQYTRVINADGNPIIDSSSEFIPVSGGIPFFKWLLSPVLVLGAEGGGTLIAVIIFLLVVGGAFNSLDRCGLMKYMLAKLTDRFAKFRYRLMAIMMLVFMAMGSLIGSFEECIPMVPIVVALAVSLGWDEITGFAMILLATGCGFAAGVFNPFTVGVAQKLSGLPMFSGAWYRLVSFALIYGLLLVFVRSHAKKVERPVSYEGSAFVKNPKMEKAFTSFLVIFGIGILLVFSSGLITALQDYTMIIVALTFLVAGIVSTVLSGIHAKELGKAFGSGVLSILPAVLLIMMASSIKYILQEANILDTILHGAVLAAQTLPSWTVILFIYLLVLVMNFFVSSGSAKAFMLIPLICPLAQVFGIPSQLCILAYAFGDGFSNVFYPTNAGLLIGLSLGGISYSNWFRWSWKFQLANLALTSVLLLVGLSIGYC